MADEKKLPKIPPHVAAIADDGFVTLVGDKVDAAFRQKFDAGRSPVAGVRHVRVWGVQVDDEPAMPGRERARIPDEALWEINLVASDGSRYEVDSTFERPVTDRASIACADPHRFARSAAAQ